MNPIFEMTETVGEFGPLKLIIEYSGGENGELEFEAIYVSDANALTPEQKREAEKILECGREEDLVRKLAAAYAGTDIKFVPNHYSF